MHSQTNIKFSIDVYYITTIRSLDFTMLANFDKIKASLNLENTLSSNANGGNST